VSHTEKFRPITTSDTHELLFASRVKSEVRRDIVDLATERSPRIVPFVVHA
jgi:hypothetical protein